MTKKNKHIENTQKELSILASLYGLSFVINDTKNSEKKFFEYTFEPANPVELSNKLIEIFIERDLADYPFHQIHLIHHNALNTLVPMEFFEEEKAGDLLDKNIKVFENEVIDFDTLGDYQAVNIYVPFTRLDIFLSSKIKNFVSKHSLSVFLEKIAGARQKNMKLPVFEIYVNVFSKDFQLVIFKNEQLQLVNQFEYENTDEFLYYLFFVWETLDINNDKMHIYLAGTDKNSDIVKNLSDFTKNFSLLPATSSSSINNYIIG